ncbi:serine hydrolase [Streptomyces yaizuensis]|uniref:Serine hydrolase n=1 Tax=Streptomyces yaizuensis TaxID=2989713 RepID=A0ABQ5P2X9_9ACTN|nr:serine hydrolase [Streptomyces sp. YSPA8]GLF96962.1 serine hydrolase [Streptomyces sp. YSPA8]
MTEDAEAAAGAGSGSRGIGRTSGISGISRRRLGGGVLALGGALALAPVPFAQATGGGSGGSPSGATGGQGGERRRTVLRHGTPERAGLLPGPLERLVTDAERFLGPSPTHPWYAGAVLLAGRGGTVALHHPIGWAMRYSAYDETTDTGVELPPGQRIPMTRETVFDLASVSKLFTAILAVRRIERDELELEAPAARYLPEFGAAGKEGITVRQLLTHTSGLRAWIPFHREPTQEGRLRMLWAEVPAKPPGSAYLYSDLNLIALQLILERISGRPLDALLRDEITAPLGMRRTRFNPPASWKPFIAATEDSRPPWSGLDRGLVRGEVHDENAHAFGGVAGHAGVFSSAFDLAVLARTLLNGGAYGRARILRPESVELMLTDFNTAFPGDEHGLGFELNQHWFMGALATPYTAGHTGFTGTSLVIDPTTDTFLVVLGNSVHPVRRWRSGSAPRATAGGHLARAIPVRPFRSRTAWFSGTASSGAGTLTLPVLAVGAARTELRCALWWDTEPATESLTLEGSPDGGATWRPVPFTTVPAEDGGEGQGPADHADGSVTGWSGRVWHRLTADLSGWRATGVRLRWRYAAAGPATGRGAYVDTIRVTEPGRTVFDASRPGDAARITADGWVPSRD